MRKKNGPLTRYLNLRVAHALGMPGTFSPPPRVSDPDMHHGTCVTHIAWCMSRSLTGGYLWSRWWGKRSRHSRRMHNPQVCVSGKRPIAKLTHAQLFLACYWSFPWNLFICSCITHIVTWYHFSRQQSNDARWASWRLKSVGNSTVCSTTYSDYKQNKH